MCKFLCDLDKENTSEIAKQIEQINNYPPEKGFERLRELAALARALALNPALRSHEDYKKILEAQKHFDVILENTNKLEPLIDGLNKFELIEALMFMARKKEGNDLRDTLAEPRTEAVLTKKRDSATMTVLKVLATIFTAGIAWLVSAAATRRIGGFFTSEAGEKVYMPAKKIMDERAAPKGTTLGRSS